MALSTRPTPTLPTTLPTVPDLQAYRIWDMPQVVVVEMGRQGSVAAIPNKLFHELIVTYGEAKTSILPVLSLIQTIFPNEPRPALEHVWLTKGMAGKREDLAAWWEEERLKNLAKRKVEVDKETEMEMGPEMPSGLSDFKDLLGPPSHTSSTDAVVASASSAYTDAPAYNAAANPILDFFNKR